MRPRPRPCLSAFALRPGAAVPDSRRCPCHTRPRPPVLRDSRCRLLVLESRSLHLLCVSVSLRDRELLRLAPRPVCPSSLSCPAPPSVLWPVSLLQVCPPLSRGQGARRGLARGALGPTGFSNPFPASCARNHPGTPAVPRPPGDSLLGHSCEGAPPAPPPPRAGSLAENIGTPGTRDASVAPLTLPSLAAGAT